ASWFLAHEYGVSPGLEDLMLAFIGVVHLYVVGFNCQSTSLRLGIPGVYNQVQKHVLDLSGVGLYSPERRIQRNLELDVFADEPTKQCLSPLDNFLEIQHSRLKHLLPAKREKLSVQVYRLCAGPPDHFNFPDGWMIGRERVKKHIGISEDDSQQIVEIVRHAA